MIHDGTYRSYGHFIEKQWGTKILEDGSFLVQGCLTPTPKVGEFVKLSNGVYEFVEIEQKTNPPDLFFGKIVKCEASNE